MSGVVRRVLLGFGVLVAGAVSVGIAPHVAQAVDLDTFHGQTPARLLDTRPGATTIDGTWSGIAAVSAGGQVDLPIAGRGGVPATGVGAVALNVTVTGPAAAGYLTVWPTGAARPTASNLNFVAGQTVPNMVIVQLGTSGRASIFNGATGGSVHVIVDVLGWFPTGSSFTGLTPARLLDTRAGAPTIDSAYSGAGMRTGGSTTALPVRGRGGVPADAAAVALNVTATNPAASGYLTVYPTGAARPTASNLNFVAGATVPNMVIVPFAADDTISIFNGSDSSTDVIVDVLGYFPVGSSFTGLTPARLMDTRTGAPTIDGRFSGGHPVSEAETYNLAVWNRGGVPASAAAVALNITVTSPNRPGYLTIHPQGAARPTASNLNFEAGQTIANMVVVPLGGSGQVSIYLADGAPNGLLDAEAEVIVDVMGWFPNPTDPPTSYGNPLVLRTNGVGAAVLGNAPAAVTAIVSPVLGTPSIQDQSFPVLDPGGYYLNPDTLDGFAHPYGRSACWVGDRFCAFFGGANATNLTFVGWWYFGFENARLIDANGLGVGNRGSDFPGAIATIDHGGCYSFGTGTAASGIDLSLLSDGQWFGVYDEASGTYSYFTPPQRDVRVDSMSAGDQIFLTEGDC